MIWVDGLFKEATVRASRCAKNIEVAGSGSAIDPRRFKDPQARNKCLQLLAYWNFKHVVRDELALRDRHVSQIDQVAAPLDDPDELQVDQEFQELATKNNREHCQCSDEGTGQHSQISRARKRENWLESFYICF